ncbi:hypothetical protein M4951_01610 [Blastopirellula sp. J2-11]|uniref:hypothetical protein n=1 Tax=Blastopirellula sp. J2-11 TaxID=2943192 RepID=UPI0021C6998A|nr:hypothetical protein [Blastopirellula sp. J2-11]UUO07021.1 hypothetical protein M4951_01610 [Blastopirellula sp. J2-11]
MNDWLLPGADHLGGLVVFISAIAILAVAGALIGFIVSSIRNGPFEAFYAVGRIAVESVPELLSISPRRVGAMTWLAFQEAIRKRALVAFALFMVVLLFSGWYITPNSESPVRLYLSFVLTFQNWLLLLMCILLSVFSLPADIQNKTIYTIYTKPVLHWEIFLGRLFGYIGVGSMMLVAMGICSYVFLYRGLDHTHQVDPQSVTELTATDDATGETKVIGWEGETTFNVGHSHPFSLDADGDGLAARERQHTHQITRNEDGTFSVSGPKEMLQARVRHLGKIRFLDRGGEPTSKGINVGNEWDYYGHIEGGTLSAAVFTFDMSDALLNEENQLPMEFNLRVFRTYKGDIVSGIRGSYYFKHPDLDIRSRSIPFTAKEEAETVLVSRSQENSDIDPTAPNLDLVENLTNADGKIELWIQCSERGQYYGVAQNSVFILKSNGSFFWNFVKCYISMWFQVVMVVTFGLVFSTFLNGPVAALASLIALGYGFFAESVRELANGEWYGGGPVESSIRLFNQKNVMVDLDEGVYVNIVKFIDARFFDGLRVFVNMLPDYNQLDTHSFVVDGYNIPGVVMIQQLLIVSAFFVCLVTTGYFFLKTREIAG